MHTLLFSGHMIDASDRKQPRFPPEKEEPVREKLKAVLQQQAAPGSILQGIAGAACGGDILFHESCLELGIPSIIYLALPPEEFKKTSVSFAGKNWEDRYDTLLEKLPVHILYDTHKKKDNIWEMANNEMLRQALKDGGENMTLIALWDGQSGDGPGGTQHLVEAAKANGAEVVVISL